MIEFLLIKLNPVQEYFPHKETSPLNCQWRESKCTVFHGDPSKIRGSVPLVGRGNEMGRSFRDSKNRIETDVAL